MTITAWVSNEDHDWFAFAKFEGGRQAIVVHCHPDGSTRAEACEFTEKHEQAWFRATAEQMSALSMSVDVLVELNAQLAVAECRSERTP